MFITKASGQTEEFSEEKLRQSLVRVGAPADVAERIVAHIKGELKPFMRTGDIYRHAFQLLRRYARLSAGRYRLKRAIMELGPSGHPFEQLVAALLAAEGFSTKVGVLLQGKCVAHETDVLAEKDGRRLLVECKYHNQPGIRSDVKVTLYVWARFQDVGKFDEAWLVTNTKFTEEAIRYAECVGMRAIGWRYPARASLEERIDRLGLHPLTCLTTLSRFEKEQLLGRGLVLAKDLEANPAALRGAGVPESKIAKVLEEVRALSRVE
jgi:hypothetical protein